MAVNNQSQYPLRVTPSKKGRKVPYIQGAALIGVISVTGIFLLPQVITVQTNREQAAPVVQASTEQAIAFPVSVDPATKSITDNPQADALFATKETSLTASADTVGDILSWIASLIDNTSAYQSLASADGHLVTILPGYRKEQVVAELAYDLNWNAKQQAEFIADSEAQTPTLTEGMFSPGTYVVNSSMTPSNVAALMSVAFDKNILVHYSSTTAQQVPLAEAITVASLLEREAAGPEDRRIISGIIWNRLFKGMNLQIDATLQYAMGESKGGNWWQEVLPKDKYVVSPYNTYAHAGLPPGPIANPSVASVLAALNPVPTSCLFYFHDSKGQFHCSDTYAEHVALLKKYYGQGK